MTRLSQEWIKDIPRTLEEIDSHLSIRTGGTLLELAARAVGVDYAEVTRMLATQSAAVIPISSGAGVIPGFADAVAAVLGHLGMRTQITRGEDVAGLGEAVVERVNVLFVSDDQRFLAIHLDRRDVVDNVWATAIGFAEALSAAAECAGRTLVEQEVLVLGLGRVGQHAVRRLRRMGAYVRVFDIDAARMRTCLDEYPDVRGEEDPREASQRIDCILDATPAAEIIDASMIRPSTIISCPGVPHGLTREASKAVGNRFIHDILPLGVAVMAVACVVQGK